MKKTFSLFAGILVGCLVVAACDPGDGVSREATTDEFSDTSPGFKFDTSDDTNNGKEQETASDVRETEEETDTKSKSDFEDDTGSETAGEPEPADTGSGVESIDDTDTDVIDVVDDSDTRVTDLPDASVDISDAGDTASDPESCRDECPKKGEKGCFDNGIRECGEFDQTDECLEWSDVTPCPDEHVCDEESAICRYDCGNNCEDFSVILLPDTQNYTKNMADNADNTYYKQAQWIVDHREAYNIKHVIHLGDITNDNTVKQWTIADKAHAILDNADVPYSIIPGNHDYRADGGVSRGATLLNDYFPPSRFSGKSWYGGSMGKGSENNYTFFESGGLKFMVLNLEFAPRQHTICWADDIIAAHPEHRVIIATHCYLTVDGKYSGNCSLDDYNILGAAGQTLFTALASRHSNIFMVVSGHVGESAYTLSPGNNGNDVHQMVVDYQFEVPCSAADPSSCNDRCHTGDATGNGWLRRLIFSPSDNTIRSETYTVEEGNKAIFPKGTPTLFCSAYNTTGYDRYSSAPDAPDHAFAIPYDMSTAVPYAYYDLDSEAFQSQTVNSKGSGQQVLSDIAGNDSGAFVIAWEDDSSDADGENIFDIHVRGFEPGGCNRFSDVVVNEDTTNQQNAPAVAMDRHGNFVVVWQDDHDGNGIYQIYARGFNPDGTERFSTMTVNAVADRQQTNPDIAMTSSGNFVVVWENNTEAMPNFQVFVRVFDADGKPLSDDIGVNPTADGEHLFPAVAMDETGGFVVVWQDDTDANGWFQIHGRGFHADGKERLARFTVNTVDTGQQRRPDIAMDETGGFVVAYEDDMDKDERYRILIRGFNADGSERFADTDISEADAGQLSPAVAMMPDGNLIATWQDDQDGNDFYQVHAAGLAADGSPWINRFTVNQDGTGQQLRPRVFISPLGTIVFSWDDDTDDNGFFQIHSRGIDGLDNAK